MQKMKKSVRRSRAYTGFIVPVLVVLVVAIFGVRLLVGSHAAASTLPVPAKTPSVPVPASGVYLGYSRGNDPETSGCSTFDRVMAFDCDMGWAGNQLSLYSGAQTAYHAPLAHAYMSGNPDAGISDKNACQDTTQLGPNGQTTKLANQPGRKVLLLSFKCGDWADVASGANDQYIKNVVKAIDDNINVPVILVFNHEPENDNCINHKSGLILGSPDDFRRAFRQFAVVERQQEIADGVNKISTGMIYMGYTMQSTMNNDHVVFTDCAQADAVQAGWNAENWWPGDDAVDWVGTDPYANSYKTYDQTVGDSADWISAACPANHPDVDWSCTSSRKSIPLMIAEIGMGLCSDQHPCTWGQTDKAAWLDDMAVQAQDYTAHPNYRKIKAIAYYDNGDNDLNLPSAQASSQDYPVMKSYAKMLFNPFFQGTASAGGDTENPVVRFGSPSPAGGAVIYGKVTITPNATDNVGVTKVDLLVDGSVALSDTNSPYSFNLDTTTLSSGAHTLQLRAYDAAGNSDLSGILNVTVDTPPNITWVSPADGTTQVGKVNLAFNVSDDQTGASMQLQYQAAGTSTWTAFGSPDTTSPYTFSWDTLQMPNVSLKIRAVVTDTVGQTDQTLGRTFTISNANTTCDVNGDSRINALDLSQLLGHDSSTFGAPPSTPPNPYLPAADCNHSGKVDGSDFTIMTGHWTW